MAILALTLPLARRSPLFLPRRDVVFDAAEDLTLQVTVVATDDPGAAAVSLAAVGTAAELQVWGASGWWDYGRPSPPLRLPVFSDTATIVNAAAGRLDVGVPADAAASWPARLGWTLRLALGAASPVAVGWGALQVQMPELLG